MATKLQGRNGGTLIAGRKPEKRLGHDSTDELTGAIDKLITKNVLPDIRQGMTTQRLRAYLRECTAVAAPKVALLANGMSPGKGQPKPDNREMIAAWQALARMSIGEVTSVMVENADWLAVFARTLAPWFQKLATLAHDTPQEQLPQLVEQVYRDAMLEVFAKVRELGQ